MAPTYVQTTLGFSLSSLLLIFGVAKSDALRDVRGAAGRLPIKRALVALGGASYSIYLMHFSCVTLLVKVAKKTGFHAGSAFAVPIYLAIAVSALLGAALFYPLVEKPLGSAATSAWRRLAKTA